MNSQKKLNGKSNRREIKMKLKTAFLMLLVTIFSISGIMTVNAVTVKDDGKYTLILTCGLNGMDGKVDGDYAKMIKFDAADGDTTVSLSELTAGVLPFNGDEIKETIPATVEDGYIVFETSHLSQYGIIATNTSATGDTSKETTSPQTGDNSNLTLWFAVLFVSFGGVVGCTVYGRRRRLNKR